MKNTKILLIDIKMFLNKNPEKIKFFAFFTILMIVFFSLNTRVKAADVDTLSFPNFGSEFQVDTLNISYVDTDTIDTTHAIMMYEKYSKVLSIDGSTITANSRSTVASTNDEAQIEYLSTNKVVAGFNSTIGPNTVTDIGNTSANPTTWAGDQNMNSVLPRYIKMKTLDSTHVVYAYADNTNGNVGKVRVGTVGASTITWGTEATFNSGGTYAIGLAVLDSAHFVVTFRDTGDTNNGNAIVGSVSGTTISWATSETTFESGRAYGYMDAAALDSSKFIVVYNDGDNSSISNAIVGSYDGASTLTFGTKAVVSAAGSTFNTVDAIDDSHAILVWTNSSNIANANIATISGNEITLLDSAVAFDTGNIQYPSVTVLDANNFLIGYKDVTHSNYAKAIVGTVSWIVPTTLTQNSFRWYENIDAITPTTAYAAENTNITTVDTLSDEDIVRLRMSVQVGGSQLDAASKTFKLQFGTGGDCSAVSNWQDIGAMASTTAPWRGYDNASVADNATISSLVLSGSDVGGTYEEENNSVANPNIIAVGEDAEWDWVLQGHNFSNQTNYCFRMTESDGTVLDTYTNYPQININNTPADASSVTATYNSDIQITVTWTDNSADEDGFIIQRRDDTGSGWSAYAQIGTAVADATSFVDNAANNAANPPAANERYQYKVIAQNTAGNSSGSEAAASIDTTPGAPTIGTPTVDSSTAITWAWTDNANFEDSYRIDYESAEGTDIDDLDADSESYQATGLTPNTAYSISVNAYHNTRGESSASATSDTVYTLANVPANLTSGSQTNTSITPSWDANSNPSGTEYYVENITSSTNSGWVTDTAKEFTGLTCSTSYTFRVKARNGDSAETAWANSVTIATGDCTSNVNGGGGGVVSPGPTGIGKNSLNINMGQNTNLGNIDSGGTNVMGYIDSSADFAIQISNHNRPISQEHKFKIIDLDLLHNLITIELNSQRQIITLRLEESKNIDLDQDGIEDVNLKFEDLYVNRAEITMTSLLDNTDHASSERLIKYANNPKVYLLKNNQKQWIVDGEAFVALGYRWQDVEIIPDSETYVTGQDIKQTQNTNNYTFKNFLSLGSISEEVRALQTKLKSLGYFTYPSITGYYGPVTATAVKAFQKANKISPLGYVGPQTRAALNSL